MLVIKDIFKKALYYGGYYKLYTYLRSPADHRLMILMYHDLIEDNAQLADWRQNGKPSRTQFEAHARYLKKHYRVLSVEQAMEEIRHKGKLEEKTAAITFDDGFSSVYEIAYPVLRKYELPATVFLLTDWINRRMSLWWVTLNDLIDKCDLNSLSMNDLDGLLGFPISREINGITDEIKIRIRLNHIIMVYLKAKEDGVRIAIMDDLKELMVSDSNLAASEETVLDWDQIKEMASNRIRFGAHTCSHINLEFADMQTAEREIVNSKKEIEKHLSAEVKGFAYPYGMALKAYSRLAPILNKNGLDYACTACTGNNDHNSDPYLLRRSTLPLTSSPALLGHIMCLDYVTDNIMPKAG